MDLTQLSVIRDICTRHGFTLSKGFGQNFIVNPSVCPKMVQEAGIGPEWGVLEIGPGIGVLTQQLCAMAGKVVAVEVDRRLEPLLAETMAEFENFKLMWGDVLKLNLRELIDREFGARPVAVCANLPYYITSPIVMKLLEERLPLQQITVMVQKEAAERLCALPGTRQAGAVSYAVHYYANPKMLFSVQPGSFYPPPKVTSTVVRLTPHVQPPVHPSNEQAMFRLIRAGFSQRRKTLANAASSMLNLPKEQLTQALHSCGIAPAARPEQLTLEQYAALSDAVFAEHPAV